MRIKKVLSLAVVLAMVLTVVPMFGLTASAATDVNTPLFVLEEYGAQSDHQYSNDIKNAISFSPISGDNIKIEFDVVYNKVDSANFGNEFIGFSASSAMDNQKRAGYNYSSVGLQVFSSNQAAFADGANATSSDNARKGTFTFELGKKYHVSLDVDTDAGTYGGTVTEADGEKKVVAEPFTGAKFRNGKGKSLDLVVNCKLNNAGDENNHVMYNLVITQKKRADVTVKYVNAKDNSEIGTSTVQAFVGEKFTAGANVDGKYAIVKGTDGKTYVAEVTEEGVVETVADGANTATVKVIPRYTTKGDNLFEGGDFEGTEDLKKWEHVKKSSDNIEIESNQDGIATSTLMSHGGEKSMYFLKDGGSDTAYNAIRRIALNSDSAGTAVGEEGADKKYLMSMWHHANGRTTLTATVGLANLTDANNPQNVDETCGGLGNSNGSPVSSDLVGLPAESWNQMGWMLTSKADSVYAEIFLRWCGYQHFDDFELYELEPVATPTTVTVKYVDEKEGTVKDSKTIIDVFEGDSYTYDTSGDGVEANDDYTVYREIDKESSTLTIPSLNAQADQNIITVKYKPIVFTEATLPPVGSIVQDGGKYYKVTGAKNYVPNPSFETADGFSTVGWYTNNGNDPAEANHEPYHYPNDNPLCYDYTETNFGSHAFGSRYADPWNGLCSILNNFKVEAGKSYYVGYSIKKVTDKTLSDGSENNKPKPSVTTGWANGAKAVVNGDDDQKVVDEKIRDEVTNEWTTRSRVVTVPGDVDAYIQFNAYGLGETPNTAGSTVLALDNIVIVEVEEVPQPAKPTVTLGWDDSAKNFTINVSAAETATGVAIVPAGGEEENVDSTSVAISTNYTNREYEIYSTVEDGAVKSAEAAKASLYELVVTEVASGKYEAAVDSTKAGKASEIITMGGFIDENLDTIQTKIMSVEDTTYTIVSDIYKLGIGFKFVDGKIYVGSDLSAAATETVSSSGGIYDQLTIDTAAKTVTLAKADTEEAITLSLDSVNIEFIETLIEEAEANGANTEADFIPEL